MRYKWVVIDLSFRKARGSKGGDRQKNASIGIRGKSVDCKYIGGGESSREYREILCVTDAEDR